MLSYTGTDRNVFGFHVATTKGATEDVKAAAASLQTAIEHLTDGDPRYSFAMDTKQVLRAIEAIRAARALVFEIEITQPDELDRMR